MKKVLIVIAGLFLVGNLAVWHAVYVEQQRGELTVAVLDIGQGDAIFIEAPNGNQILVDAGPNAKVLQELGALMPWYDKTIDMIVITNPDKDHIAGFVDVLKRFKVDYVLEPGTENKTLVNTTLHGLIAEKNVKKYTAERGMQIVLDSERKVILTVLFPDRDVSKENSNDGSIVMRLTYGETEVMLTGDASLKVEKEILEHGPDGLESDILKVGHHGSKTSTSEEFLKAVNPQYAAISLGKDNKYGHPHQEVLDILDAPKVKILRTDEAGAIIFKSNGKEFTLKNQN